MQVISSSPVVLPDIPTLGVVGQYFTRSAVQGTVPPAYGDLAQYLLLSPQQPLTAPNISLQGIPPHVTYAGVAGVPTSDRTSC